MISQPFAAAVGIEDDMQFRELYLLTTEARERTGPAGMAVGVLMSEKTGLTGIPNSHGVVYPTFEAVDGIVAVKGEYDSKFRGTAPKLVIHYNTDHPQHVSGQIKRAIDWMTWRVDGVQINNLKWEHVPLLAKLRKDMPGLTTVLQIHKGLKEDLVSHEVANKLVSHQEYVDYVWLDDSGGEGKRMDPQNLLPLIEEIKDRTTIKVGVAGGLRPDNLEETLSPILAEHPDISWDSQSGVQEGQGKGSMRFRIEKAAEFLVRSARLRADLRSEK